MHQKMMWIYEGYRGKKRMFRVLKEKKRAVLCPRRARERKDRHIGRKKQGIPCSADFSNLLLGFE